MHSGSEKVNRLVPEVPFSNIWIAKETADRIPANSVIHFGILNSLRSWNFLKRQRMCYVMRIREALGLMDVYLLVLEQL